MFDEHESDDVFEGLEAPKKVKITTLVREEIDQDKLQRVSRVERSKLNRFKSVVGRTLERYKIMFLAPLLFLVGVWVKEPLQNFVLSQFWRSNAGALYVADWTNPGELAPQVNDLLRGQKPVWVFCAFDADQRDDWYTTTHKLRQQHHTLLSGNCTNLQKLVPNIRVDKEVLLFYDLKILSVNLKFIESKEDRIFKFLQPRFHRWSKTSDVSILHKKDVILILFPKRFLPVHFWQNLPPVVFYDKHVVFLCIEDFFVVSPLGIATAELTVLVTELHGDEMRMVQRSFTREQSNDIPKFMLKPTGWTQLTPAQKNDLTIKALTR